MTINLNNKFSGKMGKSVKCNGSVGNASVYAVLIRELVAPIKHGKGFE